MHPSSTPARSPNVARISLAACAALALSACGGGGGGGGGGTPPPVDHARLDTCVLVGSAVVDGCTTSGGSPEVQLGDLAMGEAKSRVIALYDGGDGDVAASVSAVRLAPAPATHYTISYFTLQGGVETPATLPFDLRPNHATELRVRVQFTANVAVGAVSGVGVDVVTSHPAGTTAIPITANVTGCPAGRGDCDGDPSNACETDITTDLGHCGGCGTACSTAHGTPSCTNGVCAIACDAGFDNCDGSVENGCESDLSTDAAHCGSCAAACDTTNGTPTCTAGSCGITCAQGFGDCDGSAANGCETNLLTDTAHCGSCIAACSTANGTPTCGGGACGIACAADWADCDGDLANGCEVHLTNDVGHCGACGTACSTTNGTPSCSAGVCAIACTDGFADCDGNASTGCEVTLASDPLHCGACGTACNATNGTATCTSATCGIVCNPGFANCDGDPSNGCEVNLETDTANCGACRTACDATNGTASCRNGACGIACNSGYGDCDGSAANGCEVNLQADTAHCGTCGTACNATNGTASCGAGVCGITCNSGYGDCDGSASNGCEVNLNTDTAHCGACVVACSAINGAPSCSAGVCEISCAPGFADCDLSNVDGCEVNLTTDPAHCGACINACNGTNGTATCSGAACGITCDAGWADCDASLANGCEVNTKTDPANCSACGATCDATNGTPFCETGACGITCAVGFGDCDAQPANGCESDLATDPNHCNACGNACPVPANGTPSCTGGTCGIATCDAGFADCDTLPGDGCEVNVTSDVANCGGCGAACAAANVATPACVGSACAVSACAAGWTDYDGSFADGCECKTPVSSPTCAGALALGAISPGQTVVTPLDGISGGREAYYAVSFPLLGPSSAGGWTPHIQFARNDGGFAVFDVLNACGGAAYSCGTGGTSGLATGLTDYTFTDDQSPSFYSRNVAWPNPVIIRVYQAPGTFGCPTYQLSVSR